MANNYILLGELRTDEQAAALETFLNDGLSVGVTAEGAELFLHQQEAEHPYGAAIIEQLRQFVAKVAKLDARIQNHADYR
jgi:hypothetical protein